MCVLSIVHNCRHISSPLLPVALLHLWMGLAPNVACTNSFTIAILSASEWVGRTEGERDVLIKFDANKHFMIVQTTRGKPLRTIDLNAQMKAGQEDNDMVTIVSSIDKQTRLCCIRVPKEYDLVSAKT